MHKIIFFSRKPEKMSRFLPVNLGRVRLIKHRYFLFGIIINVSFHRLREHVEDVNKLPILIFPEGMFSFLDSSAALTLKPLVATFILMSSDSLCKQLGPSDRTSVEPDLDPNFLT